MSPELPQKVAGSISDHLSAWENITSDNIILTNVSGVKLIFDETPVQVGIPRQYKFNEQLSDIVDEEIQKLLSKDVVNEIFSVEQCFISNIFLRQKPNGDYRMIIDLSDLNQFVTDQPFKMDHLSTAMEMLFPNAWMASIDLKDAYYAIPVCEQDKKYLVFQWKGKYFRFNCVPFGLCSAPWIFTKTLRPIFAKFHEAGFQGFGYIDDSFIIAETKEGCQKAVKFLSDLFKDLGFRVHEDKSVLKPCHELTFLGYTLNSGNMSVRPTEDKKEKVKTKITHLLSQNRPKIREVASVLGLLNDICKASKYGLSHVKGLEIQKIKALKVSGRKQFDAKMSISKGSKNDLQWWLQNIDSAKKQIFDPQPEMTITTDASMQGWGACAKNQKTGGRWNLQEAQNHINVLELKAVELGLKSLCKNVNSCVIKVFSDNTTTIAYLKHQGGTKSTNCNEITKNIFQWCEYENISILPAFIPGIQNVEADFESRHFTENTEWMLNPDLFQLACHKWGQPKIDLFASRNNNQINSYSSWCPDPNARFTDAFSENWKQFQFIYLFPPFRLLTKVLQKVKREQVRAIVVAPTWSAQPWFAKLHHMSTDYLQIPRRKGNLLQTETNKGEGSLDNLSLQLHFIC